jgi:sulfur carrier protein ThiS
MVVTVLVILDNVSRSRSKADLDVPEGTTVKQAVELFEDKNKIPFSITQKKGIVFMVNDSPGTLETELKNMDSIRIFKPLFGG